MNPIDPSDPLPMERGRINLNWSHVNIVAGCVIVIILLSRIGAAHIRKAEDKAFDKGVLYGTDAAIAVSKRASSGEAIPDPVGEIYRVAHRNWEKQK